MRPIIQSVLVVADGAHDPAVKLEIHRAVRTVLNVADYRVYVAARRQ
jgi:stage III sporulation protein AG